MSFAKNLRASVLQAAMQGKLTEQLETDSIAFGNRAMIDDFYFDLPDTWNVVEYGSLCENRMGKTLSQKDVSQGGNIPVYSATQEDKPFGFMKDVELKLHKNDFVIPARGNSIGYVTLVKDDIATCTQTTICSRNIQNVDVEFLYYCTKAFKQQWFKYNGSAIPQITVAQVNANLVPIPPIEEQKRIVRRIEEIMSHIAELEAIEEELKKLKEIFPVDMKAAVLQAAMQGKLTEQLATDSSVDELLENIKTEREKLVKEGKIKKSKTQQNDSFVAFNDVPFDIPSNWKWVRFSDVFYKITDGTHKTPKYTNSGVHFISVKDVTSGAINLSNTKFISIEEHSMLYERCNPEKNDLLITKVGTTGVPAVVNCDEPISLFVSVALLKYSQHLLNTKFLYLALKSPVVYQQAQEHTRGIGNKNWVLDDIKRTIFPLPPIEEQQRIVDKLETILPLIENI